MHVGERIKAVREWDCMTQRELSEKSGINDANLRKYESGRQNPKKETVKRIAKALNINALIFDKDVVSDEEFQDAITEKYAMQDIYELSALLDCMYDERGFLNGDVSDDKRSITFYASAKLPPEYNLLNSEGKEETNRYIKYLSTQEKYTAPDSSTSSDHEEGEP